MDTLIFFLTAYFINKIIYHKGTILILLVNFTFSLTANSQIQVNIDNFNIKKNDGAVLKTPDFLNKINWIGIKKNSNKENGNYAYENKEGLLKSYAYFEKRKNVYFKIKSYNDKILEFIADSGNYNNNQKPKYFFDKNIWLEYVNELIPSLDESFKLSNKESDTVLKSYYKLLGVDTKDEYGFICEYSATGSAPERRKAIIKLLMSNRIDLIKKTIDYPNLQTKVYAADALIYYEHTIKQKILQIEKDFKKKQNQLLKLNKKNAETSKIKILENEIKTISDSITSFSKDLLTSQEWEKIYVLRDSKQKIITCGNSGSYKNFGTNIYELLSDKAISEIPKHYEMLKKLGYFNL